MDIKYRVLPTFIAFLCFVTKTVFCSERAELADPNNPAYVPEKLKDPHHGVKMGQINPLCDDAKVNISIDFKDDPRMYTCYHPKAWFPFDVVENLAPKMSCDTVLPKYAPRHYCMNYKIKYDTVLPTHEGHRPLWPVFGEYDYVPPQRWLHNIEHGAIVMLYHPCTHPFYVDQLRRIVTGCLRKHVITPYPMLSPERPLALVAWGCRYEMSSVNKKEVVKFIKEKALKGPEAHYAKEGQYSHMLRKKAVPPKGSNLEDSVICPND
uniref:Putative conserved secreted protein n=2 Tax=Ixodes ricinus TaxID=34613 RepID=V5HAJ5_IXORI